MTRTISGISLFLGAVLILGAWYLMPSGLGPSRANYYDLMGQALAHGRLWIGDTPCLYDTIPFGGRCYLHFGVVPGFLHLIGLSSDRLAAIFGAVVLTFYLLKTLFRLAGTIGETALPMGLFIAFGTGMFTAALCGWVYGESICIAHAFGLMGVYYALPLLSNVEGKPRPFLAGVAIALACLTRPSWFLFALVTGLWFVAKKNWRYVVPVAAAFLVQAWMNLERFQNPFEFGVAHYEGHLVGSDARVTDGIYSLKAFLPNFFTYFFTGFPPVPVSAPGGQVFRPSAMTDFFNANLYTELPVALFLTMPVLLWGVWQARRESNSARLAIFLLPMSLLLLFNMNEIYRYQLEVWLPVLVLAVPPLLRCKTYWVTHFAWISAGICLVVTAINTFWVVRTHWGML